MKTCEINDVGKPNCNQIENLEKILLKCREKMKYKKMQI